MVSVPFTMIAILCGSRAFTASTLSDGIDWKYRAATVRDAVRHAWNGYLQHAGDADDLKPVSRRGDTWLYTRATMYDGLDTLYVVGLRSEFDAAVAQIKASSGAYAGSSVFPSKTFEYHIRTVGGLLGAYSVSGDRVLLREARRAADCVLEAFGTRNGIPRKHARMAHWSRPARWAVARFLDRIRAMYDREVWTNSLAGIGSFGLEMRFLSRETGDERYRQAAEGIHRAIATEWHRHGGPSSVRLLPKFWPTPRIRLPFTTDSSPDGAADGSAGLGSGGDSYYEYLLKEHLLEPSATPELAEMYGWMARLFVSNTSAAQTADNSLVSNVVRRVGRSKRVVLSGSTFEHLSCFVPGLLALGAISLPAHKSDLALASELLESCVDSYDAMASGLGPDEALVYPGSATAAEPSLIFRPLGSSGASFQLRPETVESLFVLFRASGDVRYRDIGWRIFQRIEQHCRVKSGGFSGLKNVNVNESSELNLDDVMPSFFLAETLKYLFLLFSPTDVYALDDWVFTTEAHILSRKPRCALPKSAAPPCTSDGIELYFQFPWEEIGLGFIGYICLRLLGRLRCCVRPQRAKPHSG
jgi:mannosyl-oligosaccharide alpha-1,2-mannosidase